MYELIFAKGFLLITTNVVIAQTVPIGLYLLGMGLGVLLQKNKTYSSKSFSKIELALCALGILIPFYVYGASVFLDVFIKAHVENLQMIKFALFSFLPLSIGVLTGREFMLLVNKEEDQNVNVNMVLAATYFGNLMGGLAFPLFLYEPLGLVGCCVLVASLNMLVAFALVLKAPTFKKLTSLVILSLALSVLAVNQKSFSEKLKSASYVDISTPDFNFETFSNLWSFFKKEAPFVESYRSKYQDVDLVDFGVEGVTLYLNRKPQFSTTNYISYHLSMVEGFINLHGAVPKEVLLLGGGDGILARYLLERGVDKIKIIDLDPFITDLAKNHPVFLKLNKQSLWSPKVEVVNGDAFSYMIKNKRPHEAIFIDFPLPTHMDLSKLYSVEFYRSIYASLQTDGSAIFDSPANVEFSFQPQKMKSQSLNLIEKTVESAGITNSIIYGPFEAFNFFTRQKAPVSFKYKKFPPQMPGYVFMNMISFDSFMEIKPSDKENSIFRPVRYR
jgi:spermidine synthase